MPLLPPALKFIHLFFGPKISATQVTMLRVNTTPRIPRYSICLVSPTNTNHLIPYASIPLLPSRTLDLDTSHPTPAIPSLANAIPISTSRGRRRSRTPRCVRALEAPCVVYMAVSDAQALGVIHALPVFCVVRIRACKVGWGVVLRVAVWLMEY